MAAKGSHCSYCGAKFHVEAWPRKCGCGNESYRNPTPVVVVIVPVWCKPEKPGYRVLKYLIQQRNIEPCKGEWALAGGFVDHMETFQQAASRELFEEVGLKQPPEEIELFDVVSASNGNLLIFCASRDVDKEQILFKPNDEVSAIHFVDHPNDQKLCFPTHNEVFVRWYEKYGWKGKPQ